MNFAGYKDASRISIIFYHLLFYHLIICPHELNRPFHFLAPICREKTGHRSILRVCQIQKGGQDAGALQSSSLKHRTSDPQKHGGFL